MAQDLTGAARRVIPEYTVASKILKHITGYRGFKAPAPADPDIAELHRLRPESPDASAERPVSRLPTLDRIRGSFIHNIRYGVFKIPASVGCPDLVRVALACCLLLLLDNCNADGPNANDDSKQ